MTKKLTVHNAEIRTASVEIKTLTVSGKQVTLAVFRQLREEPLIAEDGTLNGEPWGTINYHPDKCAELEEHWHVVWQRGAELLRARVSKKVKFDAWESETGNRYLTACVWEHVHGGTPHFHDTPLVQDNRYDFIKCVPGRAIDLEGVRTVLRTSQAAIEATEAQATLLKARRDIEEGRRTVAPITEEGVLRHCLTQLDEQYEAIGRRTANQLYEALKEECRTEADRRRRHEEARQAIAELPQLFIAV